MFSLNQLKTSDKITFLFTVYNFISLILIASGVILTYICYIDFHFTKNETIIFSILLILFFIFFSIFIGKKISKYALKNLQKIAEDAQKIDIDEVFHTIKIDGSKCDEINQLAETLNKSFCKIKSQTGNLKQFITDVSHEFKTPLMVINSQIDLYHKKLEKNVCHPEEARRLLEKIKEKTLKLNKLLEVFLHLSRVENKIETLNKESISLDEYLPEVIENYFSSFNNSVKVNYNLMKKTECLLEPGSFNIILENLLSNAIKFSGEKEIIEVGCNKNSFWIQDFGEGMTRDTLDKIWNKFYRNDTNIEGFGVGLFIVKRLIKLHDWKIKVESEKGRGTKFIINF